MKRGKRALVAFSEIADGTLTEWAIDGDESALAELHHRYAVTSSHYAAVVSGRPEEASETVASAFAMTLTELADDSAARREPVLPQLLRSVRTVTLADAERGVDAHQLAASVPPGTSPELLAEVFSGLSEPERSALWLTDVAGLGSAGASVAVAVSGGASALRWTRSRSTGLDALLDRAYATLGDHRADAVQALAGLEARLDDDNLQRVLAEWPNRTSRLPDWLRRPWDLDAIFGDRDASAGRILRFAVILVLALGVLGILVDRRDTATTQTSEAARHIQAGGSTDGRGNSGTTGTSPPAGANGRGTSPSGGGPGGSSSPNNPGGPSSSNSPGSGSGTTPGSFGRKNGAPSAIGINAATGTTSGIGTSSTTTTTGPGTTSTPTSSVTTPPTTAPISGTGPGPTSSTEPSTPTSGTTSTSSTAPTTPTTEPPPTTPTTEPPTTTPTTEPPTTTPTTEPPPSGPPSTLPPVP